MQRVTGRKAIGVCFCALILYCMVLRTSLSLPTPIKCHRLTVLTILPRCVLTRLTFLVFLTSYVSLKFIFRNIKVITLCILCNHSHSSDYHVGHLFSHFTRSSAVNNGQKYENYRFFVVLIMYASSHVIALKFTSLRG